MINDVIVCLASTRHQSTLFMNEDILKLANKEGATASVPQLTTLQRNKSNTPSTRRIEHYKRIPFIDYLSGQDDGKTSYTRLFSPVPSILIYPSQSPFRVNLDNS